MTTLNEAREAMYQALYSAWSGTTPIQFDNEDYDPPRGGEWARLTVRHQDSGQDTLGAKGNRKYERSGIAWTQVFVPKNTGTARADVLATLARETFEGERLAGTTVYFTDVIVREVGATDDGWYQVNVEANFTYHETR